MLESKGLSALLSGLEVSLHYGQKVILDKVNFSLREGEIVGVVGRNGSGKSSFLKLVAGKIDSDGGKVNYKSGVSVGYCGQEFEFEDTGTVFEMVARSWFEHKKNNDSQDLGYIADISEMSEPWTRLDSIKHEFVISQINELLVSLKCPKPSKLISELSGGEKRKVALANSLVGNPDILILDEPTNHLDIVSMENLERVLKEFKGAILLVSHDRYFLDQIATRMIEIYDAEMYEHSGNYQDYLEFKSLRLQISATQEDRRQAFLKRELQWVRAGVKARETKNKGRLNQFYELKNQRATTREESLELLLPASSHLSNKIINIENIELETPNHQKIISDFSFNFHQTTKLGLIGANGSGKTTLIKAILKKIEVQKGRIVVGQGTQFNYQDQEKLNLNLDSTPFQEIGDGQETTSFGEKTISTRGYLRRFLFSNEQIIQTIKDLSGGERARLLLAKLFKTGGNCLILDEPTNDLDLETIRLLEESLLEFAGVAIVISHDRYFLNRVCNTILSLDGGGLYTLSTGNFDDYRQKNQPLESYTENLKVKIGNPYKIALKDQKIKNSRIKKLEKEISVVEQKITEVQESFRDPGFYIKDPAKYSRKALELSTLKEDLEVLMTSWEGLMEGN